MLYVLVLYMSLCSLKNMCLLQHCGCQQFVWDVVAELMGGDAAIAEKSKDENLPQKICPGRLWMFGFLLHRTNTLYMFLSFS